MTDIRVLFDADNQRNVAMAAAEIVSPFMNFRDKPAERTVLESLPRVPWFSNADQQEAFRKIVEFFAKKVDALNADERAKKAILFWVLTVHYANNRSFRLATASAKRRNAFIPSSVARSFVAWVGQEVHPSLIVAASIEEWI